MDVLTDDHEREEAVRKWWHEYWKPIALGVFIALAGLVGVRQYQSYMLGVHQEKAFEVYTHRLDLNNHGASAVNAAKEFMQQNEDIFGALLALDVAATQIDSKDYQGASESVDFARRFGGDLIATTASLTEARLKAQSGDFQGAIDVLNALSDESYIVEKNETLGDVYLAQGDKAKAREAYLKAVDEAIARKLAISPLLQMKADSVSQNGDEGVFRKVMQASATNAPLK